MKNKAFLIYNLFFDVEKAEPTIGGIQTYICDLASVFSKLDYDVVIIQEGLENASIDWNGYQIRVLKSKIGNIKFYNKIIRKFVDSEVKKDDFVVFMTHTLNCKINHKKTISIQHGIYWDIPTESPKSSSLIEFLFRNYRSHSDLKNVNKCNYCVAVDYNFLNWYKTQQYYRRVDINVIPNYASFYERSGSLDNEKVRILFARRFEKYRGTRIFAESIKKLIGLYPNVEVTFAGGGPDENYLKDMFSGDKNVSFIKFSYGESHLVHLKHDIAVVASIGSEGTSLSLLEAMGTGCAVVSSNVGGLTNIVIDGYNGLICDISADSLFECLERLVNDKELRTRLSKNAFETVKCGFSKDTWQKKWINVIEKVSEREKDK